MRTAMSIGRTLTGFAFAGAFVPVVFQAVWFFLKTYQEDRLNAHIVIQNLMFFVWPSSILILPSGSEPQLFWGLFSVSVIVNVILYTVIGTLIWFSLSKSYLFLFLVIAILGPIWWRLLTF
jgi:hypothetical protein